MQAEEVALSDGPPPFPVEQPGMAGEAPRQGEIAGRPARTIHRTPMPTVQLEGLAPRWLVHQQNLGGTTRRCAVSCMSPLFPPGRGRTAPAERETRQACRI